MHVAAFRLWPNSDLENGSDGKAENCVNKRHLVRQFYVDDDG
jgi:hypothetical protein